MTTETTMTDDMSTSAPAAPSPVLIDAGDALQLFAEVRSSLAHCDIDEYDDDMEQADGFASVAASAAALSRLATALEARARAPLGEEGVHCEGRMGLDTQFCDVYEGAMPTIVEWLHELPDPEIQVSYENLRDIAGQLYARLVETEWPEREVPPTDEAAQTWLTVRDEAHTLALVASRLGTYTQRRAAALKQVIGRAAKATKAGTKAEA